MFERFTDQARRAVVLGHEEATMLGHDYIGTEHLLLALVDDVEGAAAKALESLGVSLVAVREHVHHAIGHGQQAPSGHVPFTPQTKRVFELALSEAARMEHEYIGTEHILVGLIREGEGVAAQVLLKLGVDLIRVRRQVFPQPSEYQGEPLPLGMPAHVARLRAAVGSDLLLLPSVSVLPIDQAGRLLLVRHTGSDQWAVLGGVVEVGESPADTAVREAREEIGVHIQIRRLVDVLGGPDYQITYPNGDQAAYVTTVYEAEILYGEPVADQNELEAVAWVLPDDLDELNLNRFSRALLTAIGHLAPHTKDAGEPDSTI